MVVFPNAKINIGLYVSAKRPDGYHDLQSVFHPVSITDALEVIGNEDNPASSGVSFHSSGLAIEGPESSNLCIKAYQLLTKDFNQLPSVSMHLHKAIPMGAGMGGGSADGAFCIRLLNKKFELGLSQEQMKAYALQLGSDCPFFIDNCTSFVTGRGEHITPIQLDLSGYDIFIVHPGIHVATGWAFRHITLRERDIHLSQDIQRPVSEWKNYISNDFEAPVFQAHPEIAALKSAMYEAGAEYASMSGSGSTVFGIFTKGNRPGIKIPSGYFQKWA